jgi:hypothetical protein
MTQPNSIEMSGISPDLLIAAEIWGSTSIGRSAQERLQKLESFFVFFNKRPDLESFQRSDIVATMTALKMYPERQKLDIRREGDTASTHGAVIEAGLLDLTVRSVFLMACTQRARPGAQVSSGGTIFRPYWKESESLVEYISRVFPISQSPQQDLLSFKASKLRASYLQTYASIQIEWTNHLSDHLVLLRGETWKRLYIFRHPGFITASLETLAVSGAELTQTLVEAVKL